MHKAILGLALILLGGCAGDDLNMLAVSACQNSSNCTVTDTRVAGGPQQQRAIAPENQQRPH